MSKLANLYESFREMFVSDTFRGWDTALKNQNILLFPTNDENRRDAFVSYYKNLSTRYYLSYRREGGTRHMEEFIVASIEEAEEWLEFFLMMEPYLIGDACATYWVYYMENQIISEMCRLSDEPSDGDKRALKLEESYGK